MTSNNERPPIFSATDQLQLLQLQARRAIAERRAREQSGESAEDAEIADQNPVAQALPDVWRLVPPGVKLYDWQTKCLREWLKLGRGTVKVATGGGKTLFALAAAEELQNSRQPDLRVVIVVPTITLMLQWVDELAKSNLPKSAIGSMGGGSSPGALEQRRVLVCVLNSARDLLSKLVEEAGWSDRLLLIVDECHRANADQAKRIFQSNPTFTLGLSATPEDQDDEETLPSDDAYAQSPVGRGLGPIIYEFTLRQCLSAGLLAPFELWHVGLPLTPDEAQEHALISREISDLRTELERAHRASRSKVGFLAWCQAKAGRDGGDAARFVYLTGRRKQLLYRAATRLSVTRSILGAELANFETRAITFHEAIEEVERIFLDVLPEGIPAVLEHSKLPTFLRRESIEAFRDGTARVVISAKSLVEGFNVPSADVGIIVASTSSVRQRIQSLGRLLRRKKEGNTARIYVLYVRGTEDEAIYEKVDWNTVVGAEVNRYFHWTPLAEGAWPEGLRETGTSPRRYLPPSTKVDPSELEPGTPYPGRPRGIDLKVDQDGNLRVLATNQLVPAPQEMVERVLENRYRSALCTPAGHLIVRVETEGRSAWRYVGPLRLPEHPELMPGRVELQLRTRSGRRVIVQKSQGGENFAKGPADIVRRLLEWTDRVAHDRGVKAVSKIYWDQGVHYWVEVGGQRVDFEGPASLLEF